jgi:hypothetical protein
MRRLGIVAVGLALVVGIFATACHKGSDNGCGANLPPEVVAACDAFESYLVAVDEGRNADAEALLSPYCDAFESYSVASNLRAFVAEPSNKHVQDIVTFYAENHLIGPTSADAELFVRFAFLGNGVTFQYMSQYDGQWKLNCYPQEKAVPQAFEWLQHVQLLP